MEVTEEETLYGYLMQVNAMLHITNISVSALEMVSDIWWISCRCSLLPLKILNCKILFVGDTFFSRS
jgi:hypothetical protein